ncbi:MAG: AGE family epimerase/isomerase [Oceanicaulis sp.]
MSNGKITPVILCGGGGTRLWPLSTSRRPKQFLALAGDRTMLSETARRVADPERYERPLAIGGARHAALLHASLPDADILLEPEGRNSAPPIAAACLLAAPEDLLLVLPADHHIADLDAFRRAVDAGARAAGGGRIVTFGIKPDHPATGYGYIEEEAAAEDGARPVRRFVEKPDRETAQGYLETGGFYWNAGIFLFRAQVMLDALKAHAPDILNGVDHALVNGRLDRARFARVREESIDFAVMEHARNIEVVPVSMGWSDLGDYRALHEISASDADAPVLLGPVAATDSRRLFVHSTGPRVAVHGVEDIAVVATHGNVLVSRLSDAAGVKKATTAVKQLALPVEGEPIQAWARDWLWTQVMPRWASVCCDPASRGFIENLTMDGEPQPESTRRGRVAPRQLFTFARAKRMGWNHDGLADQVIEDALDFLDSGARSPRGGWAHMFSGDGKVLDERRDLYDHAFVALAGSEVAALGEPRGAALADEAFDLIDSLFLDASGEGWRDLETGHGVKLANPHMHLLEASLAHFDAVHDSRSAERITKICTLFEQYMFDARTGAVGEVFARDWSRSEDNRIEPGHCYEWAYLLSEAERLIGRDTASWARRLVAFSEANGLVGDLVVDVIGAPKSSFRLWPQLERLRALAAVPTPDVDMPGLLALIRRHYLDYGPAHCWIDKLDARRDPAAEKIPASMVYHLVTGLAPFAPPQQD